MDKLSEPPFRALALLALVLLASIGPAFSATFPEKFSLSPEGPELGNDYFKYLSGYSIAVEGSKISFSSDNWELNGNFNRNTGDFSGTYSVKWSYLVGDKTRESFSYGEFYGKIDATSEKTEIKFRNSYVKSVLSGGKLGGANAWLPANLPCSIVPLAGLPDSGFVFSGISGQVEVLLPKEDGTYDEEDWTFAKLDMRLPAGTRIKTSERSEVILSFADMTTFEMKPESEIILSKIGEGEPGPLKLLAGDLLGNVKKVLKGEQLVEGSQAVCGIKGTIFAVSETGKETFLKVIEGTVEFSPRNGNAPSLVFVGEGISATSAGLGNKTSFNIGEERANWKSLNGGSGLFLPVALIALALAVGGGVFILSTKRKGTGKEKRK